MIESVPPTNDSARGRRENEGNVQTPEEKKLARMFALLDEYNKPDTSDERVEKIVKIFHNAGYIIRPLNTIIIKDEANFEHLNPDSKEWGLVDRVTRRPITRKRVEHA